MSYTAIHRSCTPDQAKRTRTVFEDMGWVAAKDDAEAATKKFCKISLGSSLVL